MMKKLSKRKGKKRRFPVILGVLIGLVIGALIVACLFFAAIGEAVDVMFEVADEFIQSRYL